MSLVVALVLACGLAAAEYAPPGFAWPGGARAAVVLSYDDGIDAHLDRAAPDLDAAGLRGTFFVTGHSPSLAKRLPEWRALAARGHELGNHTIFHPCIRQPAGGAARAWVRPEYALESYSVERMRDEAAAMNATLAALDGEGVHTFAYPCVDATAGGQSYVDALRPLFLAARGGDGRIASNADALDPMLVPSFMVQNVPAAELVAFAQKALDAGGLAVFMFHGVGGGHDIDVSREAHRELVAWLAARRQEVWTDTFRRVMAHVVKQRTRAATP
jgi:peptidoglycan/xylan/chitin deacetylase (PgdA/CDA1 family)